MKIYIVGKKNCKYCDMAQSLLKIKGMDFAYEDFENMGHDGFIRFMDEYSPNAKTFPIILIDDKWIGGFSELKELLG